MFAMLIAPMDDPFRGEFSVRPDVFRAWQAIFTNG